MPDHPIPDGAVIRMMFERGRRRWWIDRPFEELSEDSIAALGNRLVEHGDSLFGWRGFSQTWTLAGD